MVTSWCGNQAIYQGGDIGNTSLAPHILVLRLDMGLMRIDRRRALLLSFFAGRRGAALPRGAFNLI